MGKVKECESFFLYRGFQKSTKSNISNNRKNNNEIRQAAEIKITDNGSQFTFIIEKYIRSYDAEVQQ